MPISDSFSSQDYGLDEGMRSRFSGGWHMAPNMFDRSASAIDFEIRRIVSAATEQINISAGGKLMFDSW
ncbi:MAG: hypothetical protein ABIY70_08940 [Capsulimonas sp.]|uniref:hypothetical protein n=1 Tax=Capsulimonas sp. TaxID=2494211 RepID=UPI0032670176